MEKPSLFSTIKFEVSSEINASAGMTEKIDLLVATTRPELLPACVAIFYHPDDKRYQKFKDSFATVPLFRQKVKILPDELVIQKRVQA